MKTGRLLNRSDFDRCPNKSHGAFMVEWDEWIPGSKPATRLRILHCAICNENYEQEIQFEDFCRLYPEQIKAK